MRRIFLSGFILLFLTPKGFSSNEAKGPTPIRCARLLRTIQNDTGTSVRFEAQGGYTLVQAFQANSIKAGEILYRFVPLDRRVEIASTSVQLQNRGISKLLLGSILVKEAPDLVFRLMLYDNEKAYNQAVMNGASVLEAIRATPHYIAMAALGYGEIDLQQSFLLVHGYMQKLSIVLTEPTPPHLDSSSTLVIILGPDK